MAHSHVIQLPFKRFCITRQLADDIDNGYTHAAEGLQVIFSGIYCTIPRYEPGWSNRLGSYLRDLLCEQNQGRAILQCLGPVTG